MSSGGSLAIASFWVFCRSRFKWCARHRTSVAVLPSRMDRRIARRPCWLCRRRDACGQAVSHRRYRAARLRSSQRDLATRPIAGGRHPLGVTASISASSRDALGEPVFTCFRVTRGSETWPRRPTTYGTQTLADGYPPGAQPPTPNEAWRMAVANDGPEWPDGDRIGLELWASVDGRRYVFVPRRSI